MIKYGYDIDGFAPFWWPRKAANVSVPKAIEYISKLGYQGVELLGQWNNQIVNAFGNVDEFKAHLKKFNLELAGFYVGDAWHDRSRWYILLDMMEQLAVFLKECNCTHLIVEPPHRRYVGGVVTDEHITSMAECFNRIAMKTLNHDVTISIHPHYNMMIENKLELDKLMQLTEPEFLGLCVDTAQLYIAGEDPVPIIETYKDRVDYFHFKDARGLAERRLYSRRRDFYEMGKGKIDFPAIMNILKGIKYDGWIVVECDQPDPTPTPYESAEINKKYVDEVLSKIYS